MEAGVFRVRCRACLPFHANRVAIHRRIATGVSRQLLQPSFVRRGRSCACFSSFPSRTTSLPPPSPPCVSSCSSIRAHLPPPLVRRRGSPSSPSRVCRAPCTHESCSSDPPRFLRVSPERTPVRCDEHALSNPNRSGFKLGFEGGGGQPYRRRTVRCGWRMDVDETRAWRVWNVARQARGGGRRTWRCACIRS